MASEQKEEELSFLTESFQRRKNQGKKVKAKEPFNLSQQTESLSQAKERALSFGHKIRDRRPFETMWNDGSQQDEDEKETESPELTTTNPS